MTQSKYCAEFSKNTLDGENSKKHKKYMKCRGLQ